MILGTLGAIVQKLDLKRLLAYSAIGNAGYMLLGISAGNLEGLQGLLLFAVIYLVMSINAFATILTLRSSKSSAEGLSQSTFHLSDEDDFADCRAEVEVLRGRASELEDRLAFALQEGRDATSLASQLKELNLELEGDLQEKENEAGELNRTLNEARIEFTQKLHNLREFYGAL